MKILSKPNKYNRGFALFEAIIALSITALGLMAIIGIQMRTMADTQTSTKRGQAIELINQFAESLKANPSSINNANNYVSPFGAIAGGTNSVDDNTTCVATKCTAEQKAIRDKNQWIRNVQRVMPLGDAAIFIPSDQSAADTRQLGVIVSWRKNEKTDINGSSNADYEGQFNISTATGIPTCPTDRICHLQFVPLTSRCAPNTASGTTKFFCPDPQNKF